MSEKIFHHYAFLRQKASYSLVQENEQAILFRDFKLTLEKTPEFVSAFSVFGLQSNASLMLWLSDPLFENIQTALHTLLSTGLGKYLEFSDVYFGLQKASTYSSVARSEREIKPTEKRKKYFVVYPFTKTAEWYLLGFEKRKSLMSEHVNVGLKHGGINQLLLYGIGMNNHEFVVSYEMDSLPAFQELVTELRSTESRLYTENDLPVLTCIYRPLGETLLYI
jgi:chlorite dismutase